MLITLALSCLLLVSGATATSSWPSQTTADASSTHASNFDQIYNQTLYYYPSYAIDGNATTYWNDNTDNALPDSLTITTVTAVNLTGIQVLSNSEGYGIIVAYNVAYYDNSLDSWLTVASLSGLTTALSTANFTSTINNVTQIRISVTENQDEWTRINEVYPLYAVEKVSSSTTSTASATSATASSTTSASAGTTTGSTSPDTTTTSSKQKSSLSGGAIGGIVVGAVVGIALVLAIIFLVRRNRRIKLESGGNSMQEYSSVAQPPPSAAHDPEETAYAAGMKGHYASEMSSEPPFREMPGSEVPGQQDVKRDHHTIRHELP